MDVLDKAWVTAHLGILGFDYHLFKAELCFRGDIKYDLNMLAVSYCKALKYSGNNKIAIIALCPYALL